jgi:hypothetical protein
MGRGKTVSFFPKDLARDRSCAPVRAASTVIGEIWAIPD